MAIESDLIHCHDPQILGADVYTAHSCFPSYIGEMRKQATTTRSTASRVYPPHVVREWTSKYFYRSGSPHIVSVSRTVRDEVLATCAVDPDNTSVIYNGVDLDKFVVQSSIQPIARLEDIVGKHLQGSTCIAFVGYEFDRKRLEVAIRAAAAQERDDIRLIVIGGADTTRYLALATNLGIGDRVHFLGHRSDVAEILAACSIFLFPTRYEAASLAILEAAAAGLAVVTTDVAMAQEVFTDATDAMLLPNTDDPTPATMALSKLLADPNLIRSLGSQARKLAENFSWDAIWTQYDELYQYLLSNRRPSLSC